MGPIFDKNISNKKMFGNMCGTSQSGTLSQSRTLFSNKKSVPLWGHALVTTCVVA